MPYQGDGTHTDYNHNENGNPHPQYNHYYKFSTKTNPLTEETWVLLLDEKVQLDPMQLLEKNRGFKRFLFSSLVHEFTSDANQQVGLLTFFFTVKSDGNFKGNIGYNKLFSEDNSDDYEFRMYYQKTSETLTSEYRVKIYAKLASFYRSLRFTPNLSDNLLFVENKHNPKANLAYNEYQQILDCFDGVASFTPIIKSSMESSVTEYSMISTITPKAEVRQVYHGGNSLILSLRSSVVELAPDDIGQTLSIMIPTSTDAWYGKTITIMAWNTRTTIVHGGEVDTSPINGFVLKGKGDKVPDKSETLAFKYINSRWVEI